MEECVKYPILIQGGTSFVDLFICICLCHVVLPCDHLLGKGCPLDFPVCDVLVCFCHFPIQCPGSGVALDCLDS